MASAEERRAARREFLAVLLTLAAGGVLGLVAAGRPWGSVALHSSFAQTSASVSGNDLVPLASAVPLVALAAVILIPAVRGTGRRVVGAVLILLAAATAVATAAAAADLTGRIERWVVSTPDHGGAAGEISTTPAWPVTGVCASVVVLVVGVLVVLRGPRWPGMGSRYERPDSRRTAGQGGAGADGAAASPAEAWDALDRGDDPTER